MNLFLFVYRYLQAGSYPVVNPDGAEYPDGLWLGRQTIYTATLLSDLSAKVLSVPAPLPSHWFMIAFINDNSNRITQAVSIKLKIKFILFSC